MPKLRKTPKILLVLHHNTSARDIKGNRYWFTIATSTISSNRIAFRTVTSGKGGEFAVHACKGNWRYMEITETLPKQQWQRRWAITDHSCGLPGNFDEGDIIAALHELAQGK